jgi:hypothetical protein
VPLGHRPPGVVSRDGADWNGPACRSDGLTHHARVRLAADAIDDDRRHGQRRIETLEAEHRGGRAARLRVSVDDQDDGRAQPLRDLGRRAVLARTVDAVEAAHHTFDDRDVGIGRAARDGVQHRMATAHPAVEVVRGPAARDFVQPRVDEVGAHLERLHDEAAPA